MALYFRDDAALVGPRGGEEPSEPVHLAVRERLQAGPCFFTDLLTDIAGSATEGFMPRSTTSTIAFKRLRAPLRQISRSETGLQIAATTYATAAGRACALAGEE